MLKACDKNIATSLFLTLDTSFLSLVYTFITDCEQLFVHRDTLKVQKVKIKTHKRIIDAPYTWDVTWHMT